MITVEILDTYTSASDPELRATITVNDDGSYTATGPAAAAYLAEPPFVPLRNLQTNELTWVGLDFDAATDVPNPAGTPVAADPAAWARNLHLAFRSGQTVARVTADDGVPVSQFGRTPKP